MEEDMEEKEQEETKETQQEEEEVRWPVRRPVRRPMLARKYRTSIPCSAASTHEQGTTPLATGTAMSARI